jgi:hypothetical protein
LTGAWPDCKTAHACNNSCRWISDLRPRFNESLLRPRKFTADALDAVDREHRLLILVHRMKVGVMMRCAHLREHPDDDSEEA